MTPDEFCQTDEFYYAFENLALDTHKICQEFEDLNKKIKETEKEIFKFEKKFGTEIMDLVPFCETYYYNLGTFIEKSQKNIDFLNHVMKDIDFYLESNKDQVSDKIFDVKAKFIMMSYLALEHKKSIYESRIKAFNHYHNYQQGQLLFYKHFKH